MRRLGPALVLLLFAVSGATADGPLLDSMDELRFRVPPAKARAELAPGQVGQAVRFLFDAGSPSVFLTSNLRGTPEWDRAGGFSFWVKGDGSDALGGLQFIYDEDYSVRYDYAFPIRDTGWRKVTVAWSDLVPVLPGPKANPLDGAGANRPSKLSALWFGKWWYWRDYPSHSYAIDEIRLEPVVAVDTTDYRPRGAPLARVLAKLRARQPVSIVTMGDSLTDFRHWANREVSWPVLLQKRLEGQYGAKVTLENPAIGGTQLRQNLVLIPRWRQAVPEPDLVTVCFGANDWEAGMRGEQFARTCRDAVDRIRRATHGTADVLLMTTLPTIERWTTMTELAGAVRTAASERSAGLADTEVAFHTAGKEKPERLYCSDRVHMGAPGHELIAATVAEAIARAGR
jgi:lysophospholipase L1-like esterase